MSEIQRYRVNYRLLASLVVGGVVTAAACYLLWRFQVDRNATRLLARAEAAETSSDHEEAFESLGQYMRLRPDETEVRVRYGLAAAKVLEQQDLDPNILGEAYQALGDAVIRTSDLPLRRKLVDFYMTHGGMDRALQPIDELLDAGQNDPELKVMRAKCLFATQRSAEAANYCYKLIGYDPKTDKFDAAKAEAADQPEAYSLLAQYLYNGQKIELAAKVAEQMIAANPKSREAYVFQYQLQKRMEKADEARAALETAYQLEPTHESVLLFKGLEELQDYQAKLSESTADNLSEVRAGAEKHLDEAAKYFLEGRQQHDDIMAFYEYGARVELARDRLADALAIIDQGLKKFDLKTKLTRAGIPLAIDLANFKIDLYFSKEDLDGVRAEIKALRDLNNSKVDPVADYHEARLELQSGNWMEAARRLEDVKIRLLSYPGLQALAGATQGACYAQLAQYDLALQAYEWALEKNPSLPQAIGGREEMLRMRNPNARTADPLQLDQAVAEMLKRPKNEQKWEELTAKIDAFVDGQAQRGLANEASLSARKQLLRAQMSATRGLAEEDKAARTELFAQARAAITQAYRLNPKDLTVQSAAPRLLALEPESGPTKAMELLDAIVKKNGDSPAFRTLRIDLLSMIRGEDFVNRVYAATEGMDKEKWTPDQQASVWAAAGIRFEQFGKFQDAQTCMARAAELAPNILQHRMALFDLAVKQGDPKAMTAAQEKILEVVKSKSDPNYVATELKKLMFGYAQGSVTKEQMQQGRAMLEQAIKQRPAMADLHLVNGQLWLTLERNQEQALASFDKALANGPANLSALNLQIRLLADLGRFSEARKKMDLIPVAAWPQVLEIVGPNVMLKVGETEEAFAAAEKVAEARPDDPAVQIWFADVAAQAKKLDVAEAATRKAVDLNPSDPDMWSALLSYYMTQQRGDDVERMLREAQLALDEEFLPLLMAKQHELFGRWPQAESILLSYYGDKLKQPNVSRRMAEFYLLWASKEPAYRSRASVYINNLLRAADEGELKPDDQHVSWARRQAARILALDENYFDSLKAEQLLEKAIAGQAASLEDQALLVEILTRRGDPLSRERAAGILKEMQKKSAGLSPERELQLGQALFDLGDWAGCKQQMRDAISRHPDNAQLRVAYINWLLRRKDFNLAERWINRLKDVDNVAHLIPELNLRLAAARGEKDRVRAMLTAMTPNLTALKPAQLRNLRIIALMANDVGDHEYGLELMREYARRAKDNSSELTRMIALHGDLDEALTTIKTTFPSNMDEGLRTVVEMLRSRRAEDAQRLDEEAERFVRMARRDDPDSAQRMVLEAEVLEIQERYDDSVAAYRALLARDDVPPLIRATAENNLAFLLSLKKADLDDALKLVNGAIDRVGPISDILDTRGLVYHAQGDAAKAVDDLKLSVKVGPTASKYFHLTAALLAAGDKKAAVDAWQQAELMDIGPKKVSKLEVDELQEVSKQIEAIRSSTAKL